MHIWACEYCFETYGYKNMDLSGNLEFKIMFGGGEMKFKGALSQISSTCPLSWEACENF